MQIQNTTAVITKKRNAAGEHFKIEWFVFGLIQ